MRDSVPSASYSSVCNVLRQWNIPLIPTYRVYRLYDTCGAMATESPLYLGCSDAIPPTCDREYEKAPRRKCGADDYNNTHFSHIA